MTYLEKCIQLAEDFTVKKQRYMQLLQASDSAKSEIITAKEEMEAAKETYISFVDKMSAVILHDNITSLN